jgi:hypothetical protein
LEGNETATERSKRTTAVEVLRLLAQLHANPERRHVFNSGDYFIRGAIDAGLIDWDDLRGSEERSSGRSSSLRLARRAFEIKLGKVSGKVVNLCTRAQLKTVLFLAQPSQRSGTGVEPA